MVVDQFEEVFTLAPLDDDLKDERARKKAAEWEQGRNAFLEDLIASTRSTPVTIVLTLRADYYGRAWDASPELRDAFNRGQVAIGPMLLDELREVITGPARCTGLEFEPGLEHRMLDDVRREPGGLPLLEYALTRLWEKRQGDVLTRPAYDAFGAGLV